MPAPHEEILRRRPPRHRRCRRRSRGVTAALARRVGRIFPMVRRRPALANALAAPAPGRTRPVQWRPEHGAEPNAIRTAAATPQLAGHLVVSHAGGRRELAFGSLATRACATARPFAIEPAIASRLDDGTLWITAARCRGRHRGRGRTATRAKPCSSRKSPASVRRRGGRRHGAPSAGSTSARRCRGCARTEVA